jgi:hypothetical protein
MHGESPNGSFSHLSKRIVRTVGENVPNGHISERQIDLVYQLLIFTPGIRIDSDPAAAFIEQSAVMLLDEAYHHA